MNRKDKMRDLLCAGINAAVDKGLIDLGDHADVKGALWVNLFGRCSKVSWHGIGLGELRISVWWGIKDALIDSGTTEPLNMHMRDAMDVACSGYLKRQPRLWILGRGGDGLFATYCSRRAVKELFAIPVAEGAGYLKESGHKTCLMEL